MGLSTYHLLKNSKSKNRLEITDEQLKKIQSVLLQILKDFSAVCDKYGFYYSLCGGSALGAVRHNGFIPWDDDIDVFMKRSDYNNFIKIFNKELGEKYYFHSLETTPELGMPVSQVIAKGTILRSYNNPDCKESGVCIDIFVLENAPNNFLLRGVHGFGSLAFGFILSCSRMYHNKKILLEIFEDSGEEVLDAIKKKARIGGLFRFHSLSTWSKRFARWNSLCKNEKSLYVVCPTGIKHYFKEIFPRKRYCVTTKLKFEDTELRVIKDYDWALRRLYGDYMKIPPIEKREKHFALELKV